MRTDRDFIAENASTHRWDWPPLLSISGTKNYDGRYMLAIKAKTNMWIAFVVGLFLGSAVTAALCGLW